MRELPVSSYSGIDSVFPTRFSLSRVNTEAVDGFAESLLEILA
jgi:hypothetical protein